MYYDNFSFQSSTYKELINDIINYNIKNNIKSFNAGTIVVVYEKNNNFKEKTLCKKVTDTINEKGQNLLDAEFEELEQDQNDTKALISEYHENISVKRGFGIIEGAILFTILAFISGSLKALHDYDMNAISSVNYYEYDYDK